MKELKGADLARANKEAEEAERNKSSEADKEEAKAAAEEEKQIETAKSNYEFFVQNACIVPKTQKRSDDMDMTNEIYDFWSLNNATIEDMVVVGSWHDTALLKKIQQINEGTANGSTLASPLGQLNVPLLPISFNFTVPGVSGFKVGDTFNITDLPNKYKTKIFQVVQVEHDISQNLWTTKIQGKMRNIDCASPKETT